MFSCLSYIERSGLDGDEAAVDEVPDAKPDLFDRWGQVVVHVGRFLSVGEIGVRNSRLGIGVGRFRPAQGFRFVFRRVDSAVPRAPHRTRLAGGFKVCGERATGSGGRADGREAAQTEVQAWPPSTVTTLPVMNEEASDASSNRAPSSSSGPPARRWGMPRTRRAPCSVRRNSRLKSVSM